MQLKNIAVVGPNGSVGSEVIKNLLKDDHFHVTALPRHTTKASPPDSPKFKTIAVDYEHSKSLVDALRGQDAVVCCVPGGQTKFGPQKLLIDAAIEAGVKLFFASEFVSNILSPHYEVFPTEFVGDKPKIRRYLEEKASANEIAYTALNGGPFFDMWLMRGPAGFDIAGRKAKIYGTGNNLSCWTPLPAAAVTVVNMLRNPDPIINRGIFIAGVRDVTQNNILAALESVTREKFEVEHVDMKGIKKNAMEALARGDNRGAVRGLTLNSNFNEEDSAADFWGKVENDLVGVKVVSVEQAVRDAMAAYGEKSVDMS